MAEESGWMKSTPQEFLNKMAITIWAKPNPDNPHFNVKLKYYDGPIFSSPTPEIAEKVKNDFGIDTDIVKTGKIPSMFKPIKKVRNIKTLGMNGQPFTNTHWDAVKRPELLNEIAELSDCKTEFICNSKETGSRIYKDIDMYVCASVHDAGPAGIVECAFGKIPVISTPTGYGNVLKSIKTFETVEEAAAIIKELNSSPDLLEKYVNEVYEEVLREYDITKNAIEYWIPFFEKRLNLNKS